MLKNKVIVTGGLGLIGSHMCDILVERGCHVTAIDNLYRGKKEYLQDSEKVDLIQKDILDLTEKDVISGSDTVFHVASKVLGIGYSAKNHQDMMFYNDEMTNRFFDYLGYMKSIKHLVIVSSSCVYDDNLEITDEPSGTIGLPEMANLGYGLAKRFLEQKSLLWARENGVRVTIVRPFNIYGERYTWAGEFSQGLPSLVKRVLDNNGAIDVWGRGSQRRNYMHAFDCAKIILDIADKDLESGEIVNIGLEETISLKELAEKMCLLYGVEPKFTFLPHMPEGRLIKSSDETKLKTILPDFKSDLVPLDEGLLRMRDWYLKTF
jgi:UDP-glucose 4-epimerase